LVLKGAAIYGNRIVKMLFHGCRLHKPAWTLFCIDG
jgi:hypothetical protein